MSAPVRIGPRAGIEPPPVEESAVGLTSVANVETTLSLPSSDTNRWEMGYAYWPRRATSAWNRSTISAEVGENVVGDQGPDIIEAVPWLMEIHHSVSTLNFQVDDWPKFVDDVLMRYTTKLLERELWTGEIAQLDDLPNRYLAHPDTHVVSPSGASGFPSVQRAVAALSRAAAAEGTADIVIHMPRDVAVMMPDGWAGADLRETFGFEVAIGSGYGENGPNGSPLSGGAWIYATEKPNVRLSGAEGVPDDISEAIDRRTNTITVYAQRYAVADYAGPAFASPVLL